MSWPRKTSGQVQKNAAPMNDSPSAYSVKIPVDGEM